MMALNAGTVEAGHELLALLRRSPSRTHEVLGVSRLLAHWLPGDEPTLVLLRDAALADNDPVFARALLHAQHVLSDPAHAPVAPALHRQTEHAETMVKLLAGPSQPGHEALGLVWQHVLDLFRETGPGPALERKVEQGGGTPLGELLLEVARLFGVARVGVYQVPSNTAPEFEVVLTHPAALVIRGTVASESPVFRYHFGRMMFATRPEYALAFGLEEKELSTVLGSIAIGFDHPAVWRVTWLRWPAWRSAFGRCCRPTRSVAWVNCVSCRQSWSPGPCWKARAGHCAARGCSCAVTSVWP